MALPQPKAQDALPTDWLALVDRIGPGFAERASEHDETGSFVAANLETLKQLGFYKALVPAELGGGGASHAELCAIIRRLATYCGSTALTFSMHCHLIAAAAWRWRHERAPTDGLLKRVAAENLVLCSSGGSDWLESIGRAEKVEGGFRIHARKIFSSGCLFGDLLMTSAVYDDPQAGSTVLHFGVPLKAEGVTILNTWRVMGMRGSGSHDVQLENVFVPDAGIAGRRPQGKWHPLFHVISMLAMPLIYAAYVGVAEAARDKALAMARGKAVNQGIIFAAGELDNAFSEAVMALDRMIASAAERKPGPETTGLAMFCRRVCGAAAITTVEKAMELAGGSSFYRSVELERLFRDVQGARFHPLRDYPQLNYAGRLALSLDLDG